MRQIELIGDVGTALDRYVRKPMVGTALDDDAAGRRALAGLSALQDFLERGFAAFRRMRAPREFLATIDARETRIHDAIVGGVERRRFPIRGRRRVRLAARAALRQALAVLSASSSVELRVDFALDRGLERRQQEAKRHVERDAGPCRRASCR